MNNLYLAHHGIKGQKWGVRRYQDTDGTYTAAGRAHYGFGKPRSQKYVDIARKAQDTAKKRMSLVEKHYARNNNLIKLPKNDADARRQGWTKLSDKASAMHQYYTKDGVRNSKWISPDGHSEVVFTGKGRDQKITTHDEDVGTYNYYDPTKNPFGHAIVDVMPYIFLGNTRYDSTTVRSRIGQSVKNFVEKPTSSMEPAKTRNGQKAVKKVLTESNLNKPVKDIPKPSSKLKHSDDLYLEHHGIKGMKWGIRRYQNPDGSLTEAGYRKYYNKKGKLSLSGELARNKANDIRDIGQSSSTHTAVKYGLNYWASHKFYKKGRRFIANQAKHSLYNLSLKQVSAVGIHAMSATFVAGYAALAIAEIYPYANHAYRKIRYNHDETYKTMTDQRADLKETISAQKRSTTLRLKSSKKG